MTGGAGSEGGASGVVTGAEAGDEAALVPPGAEVTPALGWTDGSSGVVGDGAAELGEQTGLRFGFDASLLVSSPSRRTASGRLSAWMPCLTRSCATCVRSSSRELL